MAIDQLSFSANNTEVIQGLYYSNPQFYLTEWDTVTIPKIAGGSVFILGGTPFKFTIDTAISGTAPSSDGEFYIYFAVTTGTPTWTTTTAGFSWDESNMGWYDTSNNLLVPCTIAYDAGSFYKRNWVDIRNKEAAVLSDSSYVIKTKLLKIGSWDMDSSGNTTVAHGITTPGFRVVSLEAFIFPDSPSGNVSVPFCQDNNLGGAPDGRINITSTTFGMQRTTGGLFDSTLYNDTTINRGYIKCQYIDRNLDTSL